MVDDKARKLVIAIDGPAGAGKSTIASRLARSLGYTNIETGAMYRALALKAITSDVSVDDEPALLRLAEKSHVALEPTVDGNRVLLDGQNISQRIRERDVSEAASRVSVHPRVREWMVARQREMGASGGVVMEGRDIGTKVFPNADVKIFLDADPAVRGERRYRQQSQPAAEPSAKASPAAPSEAVLAEMRERDQRDRTRANSPLAPASDSIVIDSTNLGVDEVLKRVKQVIAAKGG